MFVIRDKLKLFQRVSLRGETEEANVLNVS